MNDMESSNFCMNWAEVLPLDHRKALLTSLSIMIDDYLDDPESSDALMLTDLPPRYSHRYNGVFTRMFLVSLVTVGYRLAERNPPPRLLACVAEELALHVMIIHASSVLETSGVESDFDSFIETVFEDQDYALLYSGQLDGIEDSEIGAQMGISEINFEEWFRPYQGSVVHPYATG